MRAQENRPAWLLALLMMTVCAFPAAHGADIYRWVDDSGRVHFSDQAPNHSRKNVTRTDSSQYEVTPERRRDAKARAARNRVRSAGAAERIETEKILPYSSGPQPGSAASAPAASALPANDCATLLRRFQESSECYAPFMNVNGSFKPHAYETCGPAVPYPARECS